MKLLNLEIDNITKDETISQISNWIRSGNGLHIVATVNPEMVMAAQNNNELREAINASDTKLPEAAGIIWAGKKLKNRFKERIPGVDLIWELAKKSNETNWRWYLLGAAPGIAKQAANKLKEKYPRINIVKSEDGGLITLDNLSDQQELVDRINKYNPDILIVSLGVPKQELFLKNYKEQLNAKVAIGAGGTLDFISGKRKRAPKILRVIWLEWLWRLIWEPKRFKRIWTATVSFPIAVLKSRNIKNDPKSV